MPVEKSRKSPEIKPWVSPKNFPFKSEKYIEQINTKSGTTSKKLIFERIEDSIITALNKIKVLIKKGLIISLPLVCQYSFCHLILFD